MTNREMGVQLHLMGERLDASDELVQALTQRLDAQELMLSTLTLALSNAQQGTGNVTPLRTGVTPGRWLESARYGKACAGTCGTRVEPGQRSWYERDTRSVFCVPCGEPRAQAQAAAVAA